VKPKVFLCSGFSDLSQEEAGKLGVIMIFGKPFDMNELTRTVLAAIGAS